MVEQQTDLGWEFIFAGANMDAMYAGEQYGFQQENIAEIHNGAEGQSFVYEALTNMHTAQRNEPRSFQASYNTSAKSGNKSNVPRGPTEQWK